jgi:tetratricopeptide (TPR) repeat protein
LTRIEQLKEFLQNEPQDAFLNYALAIEYIGTGRGEEAQEIFAQLIKNQPEYSATYLHYGRYFEKLGNKERAEEIYRKGIVLTMRLREQHNLAELQTALNNMLYDEE